MNLNEFLSRPDLVAAMVEQFVPTAAQTSFLDAFLQEPVDRSKPITLPVIDLVLSASVVLEDILDADHVGYSYFHP